MNPSQDFPPLDDAAMAEIVNDDRLAFAGTLNVYRTMAHHPALLRAWADLRTHLVAEPTMGKIRSEVVILRTGTHLGSDYEWLHHVSRARACGLPDSRVASLRGNPDDMLPEDAILARGVDDLMRDKELSAASIRAIRDVLGTQGLFDLIAIVGFYSTLGYILNSFDTPLDDAIRDEMARAPLASD